MGKTALLRYAADQDRDMLVLSATGVDVFTARRLGAEGVVILFAARGRTPPPLATWTKYRNRRRSVKGRILDG